MKKIVIMLFTLFFITLTDVIAYNATDNITVVKSGKLIKIQIICTGDTCSDLDGEFDLKRIKAIAKLKSVKSWSRIIENGKLVSYNIKYKKNTKILTYIICNSIDNKLIDNNYGVEIFYKDN